MNDIKMGTNHEWFIIEKDFLGGCGHPIHWELHCIEETRARAEYSAEISSLQHICGTCAERRKKLLWRIGV